MPMGLHRPPGCTPYPSILGGGVYFRHVFCHIYTICLLFYNICATHDMKLYKSIYNTCFMIYPERLVCNVSILMIVIFL